MGIVLSGPHIPFIEIDGRTVQEPSRDWDENGKKSTDAKAMSIFFCGINC